VGLDDFGLGCSQSAAGAAGYGHYLTKNNLQVLSKQ